MISPSRLEDSNLHDGDLILVYLSHPYRANPARNAERVIKIAHEIISASAGNDARVRYAPLIPHLVLATYDQVDGPQVGRLIRALSAALVASCDEVWIVSAQQSVGMQMEVEIAAQTGVPVVAWEEVQRRLPKLSTC